jgi:hypothetical protein
VRHQVHRGLRGGGVWGHGGCGDHLVLRGLALQGRRTTMVHRAWVGGVGSGPGWRAAEARLSIARCVLQTTKRNVWPSGRLTALRSGQR